MLCLGIESSCDDTGLALASDGKIIDSILASQTNLHAIFGGVVPELASREHGRLIGPLFDHLLARNSISPHDIDLISVTRGPGLLGSLLVGLAFAKSLALTLNRPLIGINHLEAHLLAGNLASNLVFPCLGLLISGGHTEIYKIDSPVNFKRMGRTLDDAAGEIFDKVGASLGLAYPAGPEIDRLCKNGDKNAYNLPRPYLDNENLDFSFSGLKTAAIRMASDLKLHSASGQSELRDFFASLNFAVAETLGMKCQRALDQFKNIKSLCVAGGVAANALIRSRLANLAQKNGITFIAPPADLCGDNGAMIAYAGYSYYLAGFRHDMSLDAIPRGCAMPNDMKRIGIS